jgi:hypothetical protein
VERAHHSGLRPGSRLALVGAALGVLLVACADGVDRSELTGGDVAQDTVSYRGLDYDLTSDNYRRWLAANDALDSARIEPDVRLNPRTATGDDIDAAVQALEADERASTAIRGADISVRDYVLTSVALAQSWDAIDRPTRVTGIPVANVNFLRTQDTGNQVTRSRPTARIIGDSDSDSDSEADSDSEGRGNGKARGRGKGKSKDKGKGRG